MADLAVEIAAKTIEKRLENHHKKHCKRRNNNDKNSGKNDDNSNNSNISNKNSNDNNDENSQVLDEECTCGEARLNIEEGKTSPVIISPITNRKADRREGVSEMNNTERKLVKEAVKVVARSENMVEFNFL